MNKFPASLRSDFSDCRFASEQVPLCFGIRADFIGILTLVKIIGDPIAVCICSTKTSCNQDLHLHTKRYN